MPINLDKPHLWNADTAASVDLYNRWFMTSAPEAFRATRAATTEHVEKSLRITNDLHDLSPAILKDNPGILPTLRMACCPPLAVDRLIGLAGVSSPNVVKKGLELGRLPPRLPPATLDHDLEQIIRVIRRLLDEDIFPWLAKRTSPTEQERHRASTIVADRLCGSIANPIIKNAQEKRQLSLIGEYLTKRGYRRASLAGQALQEMQPGTYAFHVAIPTRSGQNRSDVSVDVVVQPFRLRRDRIPILIEAKSAGDFTNTNKRRKEEAKKIAQLKATFGDRVQYVLFLCGYFNSAYLGYEAAEGIDWIWEHRISDMDQLGV